MSRIFLYVYDLVTFVRVEIHWKKKMLQYPFVHDENYHVLRETL